MSKRVVVFVAAAIAISLIYATIFFGDKNSYVRYFQSAFTQSSRLVTDRIVVRHANKLDTLFLCVISDAKLDDYFIPVLEQSLELFEIFTNKTFPDIAVVPDITYCKDSSNLFIYVASDKIEEDIFSSHANHILNIKNSPIETTHYLSTWGNVIHFIESEDRIYTYVSVSLFSGASSNSTYKNATIASVAVEELYQAITIGADITVPRWVSMRSILQEKTTDWNVYNATSRELIDTGFFLNRINHKLCKWDIINLYFLSTEQPLFFWKDYKKFIRKEFKEANRRAEEVIQSGEFPLLVSDSC